MCRKYFPSPLFVIASLVDVVLLFLLFFFMYYIIRGAREKTGHRVCNSSFEDTFRPRTPVPYSGERENGMFDGTSTRYIYIYVFFSFLFLF